MRWLLLVLSVAAMQPVFGELAVYSGSFNVQNGSVPSATGATRVAEVIDLDSGTVATITLIGSRANFSYLVGSEEQFIVAKATDAQGRAITALAQVAGGIDGAGSNVAYSTTLRGRDVRVNLAGNGASMWPRTLVGSSSLVASAGTDAGTAPGRVTYSTTLLTLNERWSRLANAAGPFALAADAVGQAFRDRVAVSLHYPVSAADSSSSGVTKTGTGNVLIAGGSVFGGSLSLNGGSFQSGAGTQTISSGGLVKTGTGTAVVTSGATFNGGLSSGVLVSANNPVSAGTISLLDSTYTPPPVMSGSGGYVGGATLNFAATIRTGTTINPYVPAVSSGSLQLIGSGTSQTTGATISRFSNAGSLTMNSVTINPASTTFAGAIASGVHLTLATEPTSAAIPPGLVFNPDGNWVYTATNGSVTTGPYTIITAPPATTPIVTP